MGHLALNPSWYNILLFPAKNKKITTYLGFCNASVQTKSFWGAETAAYEGYRYKFQTKGATCYLFTSFISL